ncbi:MAG: competence/damage-inducible protein A [Clostridia bacterium]|nr:competence/damage-inducible protein A [Clostridia bacterium]
MNAEIINIGTELLLGDTVNTHHSFIARELAAFGINTYHQCCVGDNPERIDEAVKLAAGRSDLIITTGGLGPTVDDITKQCVAKAIGKKLVFHQESAKRIEEYFERKGNTFPDTNYNQAYLPQGCIVLNNEYGTAPGCICKGKGLTVIMLPGPPRELIPMWRDSVAPYLEKLSDSVIYSQNVRAFAMSESKADILISDIKTPEGVTIAPYAKNNEILIRVTAKAKNIKLAKKAAEPVAKLVAEKLGDKVYSTGECESLAEKCVKMLCESGKKAATAESCTGGLIAKMITDIPGSSTVFELGEVCYCAEQKNLRLGVPMETIDKFGIVSCQVAEAMAKGVMEKSGADFAIATTGVAGPGGGTPETPVGTVCVAVCGKEFMCSRRLSIKREKDDRDYVRNYSAAYALDMLRRIVDRK